DDVVTDDATATFLEALTQNPDCVTAGHVVVLRRSIALVAARKSVIDRDGVSLETVSPLIEREARIDRSVVHRPVQAHRPSGRRPLGLAHAGGRFTAAGSAFPFPAQRLLLTAALRRDEGALRAWEVWVREIGTEHADPASTRLFPLVWWNLRRLG